MGNSIHDVPKDGTWLYVSSLEPNTTDEELSRYFEDHGMVIPPENCSTRFFPGNHTATAIISVPKDVVAALVSWACNDDKLGHEIPRIQPMRRKDR